MKRVAAGVLALAFSATLGVGAARADNTANTAPAESVATAASSTNDLLSKIPGLGGPSTRHVCVIDDPLDFYYCVYIPLP